MEYNLDISPISHFLVLGILFIPLLTAMTLLVFGKDKTSGYVASFGGLMVLVSALLLGYFEWNNAIYVSFNWFFVGDFAFNAGFLIDNLVLTMLVVVSLVAMLVNVFSIEYMRHDPNKGRYFMFLGLFAFSMYGIVLSSNLFLTFFFWELVGFSSYLLIGFWFSEKEPPKASFKAFIINRVGDVGFLMGLFVVFVLFKSFEFPYLWNTASRVLDVSLVNLPPQFAGMQETLIVMMGLGLFLGAVGKSAQFPLQTWLPAAMAGPTPVSALIHAATMVAAGVFLLIRVFPLMSEPVLVTLAVVGSVTAFMGAFAAFAQQDIKKVLAYSTISQLGYMVMAVGIGAPTFAFFHLVTHAFFKAGLFLCAGSVIHFMHVQGLSEHDSQNMSKMGGLRRILPFTFIAYTICMMALAGIPFFSGYFSKEGILMAASVWNLQGYWSIVEFIPIGLGLASVFMTASYMGRQYFLVFWGETKSEQLSTVSRAESIYFKIPLVILSLLSIWFVYSINPFEGEHFALVESMTSVGGFVLNDISELGEATHLITYISIALALLGLFVSYWLFYKQKSANQLTWLYRYLGPLSRSNWFLDELQVVLVIKPVHFTKRLLKGIDSKIVDGFVNLAGVCVVVGAQVLGWLDKHIVDGVVNLIADVLGSLGQATRKVQGGEIQAYFIWAILGILVTFLLII